MKVYSTWRANGPGRKVGDEANPFDGGCFDVADNATADEIAAAVAAERAKWGPCAGMPATAKRARGSWYYAAKGGIVIWSEYDQRIK